MTVESGKIDIVGYIMFPEVDLNEYWDYVRKSFYIVEIRKGLEFGAFPPGLVMRDCYGRLAIVEKDRKTLKYLSW